jgi:hypothetical protein
MVEVLAERLSVHRVIWEVAVLEVILVLEANPVREVPPPLQVPVVAEAVVEVL